MKKIITAFVIIGSLLLHEGCKLPDVATGACKVSAFTYFDGVGYMSTAYTYNATGFITSQITTIDSVYANPAKTYQYNDKEQIVSALSLTAAEVWTYGSNGLVQEIELSDNGNTTAPGIINHSTILFTYADTKLSGYTYHYTMNVYGDGSETGAFTYSNGNLATAVIKATLTDRSTTKDSTVFSTFDDRPNPGLSLATNFGFQSFVPAATPPDVTTLSDRNIVSALKNGAPESFQLDYNSREYPAKSTGSTPGGTVYSYWTYSNCPN